MNNMKRPWSIGLFVLALCGVLAGVQSKKFGALKSTVLLGKQPSGAFLIAQEQFGWIMLVGEPSLADTAEAEKIELVLGQAPDIP